MSTNKKRFFAWFLSVFAMFLLVAFSIALDQPHGSIAGRISLQMQGFGQSSYDIKGNKVYALATGPRGRIPMVERGVWVNPDGTFQIDNLPTGEYSLLIRANGFGTQTRHGVFVDEGQVTELPKSVAMYLLSPRVNVASNTRVFTTKEQPHFWINAMGANYATVKIYKGDFYKHLTDTSDGEKWFQFNQDLSLYRPSAKHPDVIFGDQTPVETLSRRLEQDAEDWSRAEFKLSKPLPQGDYFAVVEINNVRGQKNWNLLGFTVSNLGLVVKQAPEKTVVRAIDLETLKPREGVRVELLDRDNLKAPLATITTGADGFAAWQASRDRQKLHHYNLLVYGSQEKDRAYGGVPFWRDYSEYYQTYFYTERPIYRLGQTVYYKGITRVLEAEGFRNPGGGLTLSVAIEDPDNNKLWQGDVRTNEHGTFHGVFDLPEDGKTGAYQVIIRYPDGTYSYERFEVAQYRKPEYQVKVLPVEPRVLAGGKARARIRANYYFGAPVTNARVKYSVYASPDWTSRFRLMPRPDHYSFYDDWDLEDYYYDYGYAGDFIIEGYATTDANGEAMIEFDTRKLNPLGQGPFGADYLDKRYKIQVEVTDISRMSVVGNAYVQVTAGNFAMFVQPRRYVYKVGEPVDVDITVVDYDGNPMANQAVSVGIKRWVWDQKRDSYREIAEKTLVDITTDDAGQARATLQIQGQLATDTYYITAQARDDKGHTVFDQNAVWIASSAYPYIRAGKEAQREPLSLKLDKAVYQPGETAKLMITAPVSGDEGAEAIVSIESTQLHDYRVVSLTATAQLVEIPLKETYAPNVYVTVAFVGKRHQFHTQTQMIKVSPENRFLSLQVQTDKPDYKPGEQVTYTVKATYPDGTPAQNTELSLGVVDESIYAIRPETAMDIQKFFYQRRSNWVVTVCSFPEEFSGGPDKDEPQVRKDFRDVATWLPVLVTNQEGIATATVTLPDNLTTWRATIRAVSTGTDVGSVTHKIVSSKDLLVRLALPRFFTQGDEGRLTAIVHNYTKQPQTVQVNLQTTGQFAFVKTLEQTVKVDADKAERVEWPMKVAGVGEATIVVKAVGQTDSDALELKRPVRPLGLESFEVLSGVLADDSASAELAFKLPQDMNPETARLRLSLAASSLATVTGNYSTLIDYPYGCVEQTMSRLMPSIIAYQLNKKLGVPLSQDAKNRFQKVYDTALPKIRAAQNANGGWGWWRNDESNFYLTAYVLEGLHLLGQVGYPVEKQLVENGITWLRDNSKQLFEQLKSPHLVKEDWHHLDATIDYAYAQYVLALNGEKISTEVRNWVFGQGRSLPPEALAYFMLAFYEAKDDRAAQATYPYLAELANENGQLLDWDHTSPLLKRLGIQDGRFYTYRFTGVESTALALRAMVAVKPEDPDKLEYIKQWLLLQRDREGWRNTKSTAQVLRALMEEELAVGKGKETLFSVMTNLLQTAMAQLRFDQSNLFDTERLLEVPFSALPEQGVQLQKLGPGRLFYHGLLTFTRRLLPGDAVAEKAVPEGLQVKRAFFRLEPTVVSADGRIRFKTRPLTTGRVHAGETILMKVYVDSPVALPYVMLDTPLPSGGEVVSDDPRKNLLQGASDDNEPFIGDWGAWWWTHQDVLDDRVVFFVTRLPAGKVEFHAMVRMELPGTFQINPVQMSGMYTPHIRGYSGLNTLTVVE